MTTTTPYKKRVLWLFEAPYYEWAITSFSDTQIDIEETRKNGQEDCHIHAWLRRVDGRWKLGQPEDDEYDDPEWTDQITDMCGEKTARAVEDYINEHGLPGIPESSKP